jgi:broad specificity phosphatase PhoE
MIHFVLIRHGETDWNREGRWQGQADVPLNSHGLEQAASLAQSLNGLTRLDAIYSSDLLRARQTAAALAQAAGLSVRLDPRLREIHQGEWQGLRVEEIEARYSHVFHQRSQDPWEVAPPGGETAAQVRGRVKAALNEIAQRHPDGTVAIVSHGFTLAVARTLIADGCVENIWALVPENCAPLTVEWSESQREC